jgi:hypothetical protein
MAVTIVATSGTSTLATVPVTYSAVAGDVIVLSVSADDYNVGNPTGFTLSPEMEQETFLGSYVWWRKATGSETTVSYVIGSATVSSWAVLVVSGLDASPFDVSEGQFAQSSDTTYSTANITPTAGQRLIIAAIGGSLSAPPAPTTQSGWTNGFTEQADVSTSTGTADCIAVATLEVAANGSTAYSTASNYSQVVQARTAMAIAFKVASAGGSPPPPRPLIAPSPAAHRAAIW